MTDKKNMRACADGYAVGAPFKLNDSMKFKPCAICGEPDDVTHDCERPQPISDLVERIAYKLFKAYEAGRLANKFNDIESSKEVIALVEPVIRAKVLDECVEIAEKEETFNHNGDDVYSILYFKGRVIKAINKLRK